MKLLLIFVTALFSSKVFGHCVDKCNTKCNKKPVIVIKHEKAKCSNTIRTVEKPIIVTKEVVKVVEKPVVVYKKVPVYKTRIKVKYKKVPVKIKEEQPMNYLSLLIGAQVDRTTKVVEETDKTTKTTQTELDWGVQYQRRVGENGLIGLGGTWKRTLFLTGGVSW